MKHWKPCLTVLSVLALSLGACSSGAKTEEAPAKKSAAETAPALTAPDLSQAGTVSGKVSFKGKAPKRIRIRMGAEPQCAKKHKGPVYAEDVEVNKNGTLRNVFVWVKSGLEQYKFETPSDPVTLDQDGCMYSPHVLGVQVHQKIEILNTDPVTHNIHPIPKNNREWNISQSASQKLERSFARQEIMIPVKCNVHPWMKAYIGVVAHPYFAVTGEDGSFEIKNLPPGKYTLEAWHEKFGTEDLEITLEPNGTAEANFSFEGK